MHDLTLALTGDALLTRGVPPAHDPQTVALHAAIRAQDLAFTNIEMVPNDFRGHPSETKGSHLVAPARVLDDLLDLGFNLFSTANNHACDYGIAGLLATLEELEARGMAHAGIGANLSAARRPAYVQHAKGTVAVLACSSSYAPGSLATDQTADLQGRPGVAPLRFETVYEVRPDQLEALRGITADLGVERQRVEKITKGFGWPPKDPDAVIFDKMTFRAAAVPAIRTAPHARDLEDIARWIAEARNTSDVVVMSVHSHEQGATDEDVPEFLPTACRAMIDAGADMVVGHGPHLLRGMEVYQGCPIFYSLGNFFGQSDLVSRFAADVYERYRTDLRQTPSAIINARTAHDTRSFPADRRYWETVMPVCRWRDGTLAEVEILPIALGHGLPMHRRGLPWLAEGRLAQEILDRFIALSEPYGATFTRSANSASLVI